MFINPKEIIEATRTFAAKHKICHPAVTKILPQEYENMRVGDFTCQSVEV